MCRVAFEDTHVIRERIQEIFMENVFGMQPDTTGGNPKHDGGAGHWFETQMGVTPNADNAPDLLGFECKNGTRSKTTFGDWEADYLIWRDPEIFPNLEDLAGGMRGANSPFRIQQSRNKDEVFLPAFGRHMESDETYTLNGQQVGWENNEYYSWSWIRKIRHGFSNEGQRIVINDDNSISVVYSYTHDARRDRDERVPEEFRIEDLTLISWSERTLTDFVENKFGVNGWFKGIIDRTTGRYTALIFGEPITFDRFLEDVRDSHIYFDTRLKERRPDNTDRFGMNWRANNTFWEEMADERFDPPLV